MKTNTYIENKKKNNVPMTIICLIIITFATIVCSFLVKVRTASVYNHYYKTIKAGYIAEEDIYSKSSIDLIDKKATEALQNEVASSVLPVFSFDTQKNIQVISEFEDFKNESEYNSETLIVSYNLLTDILEKGYFKYSEINELKQDDYKEISINSKKTNLKVKSLDSLLTSDNINAYIDNYLSDYSYLSNDEVSAIKLIVKNYIQENVYYDELLTQERKASAIDRTMPVVISLTKGQLIIEKDHVITPSQVKTLELLSSQNFVSAIEIFGDVIFCLISYALILFVFTKFNDPNDTHLKQYLFTLTAAVIFNLLFTYLSQTFIPGISQVDFKEAFLPIIFVPILMTMISSKKRIGFCSAFVIAISMTVLPFSNVYTFFYVAICGCGCVFLTRLYSRRIESFYQWLVTTALCVLVTIIFVFIGSNSFDNLVHEILSVVFFSTVSNLLAFIILPLLEKVMNLPTTFRLHELGYSDSPLLKLLSQAAPGTFSHSKIVSELSGAACQEIGANAMLAMVGGLYHDIGKTEHPEYFVENQSGGENKHDDINPSLSASILKNHVSVGAAKAKEAGLPTEIVNIIANHHGNDVIAYFYHEALKEHNDSDNEEVQSADYSYNNAEIPNTKECAVVMLADSIEAAARTVQAPTPAKFSKLIHQIVLGKIERNQLTNSGLTFKDIDRIEKSFLQTLTAQYHSRIEYPDEEE